MPQTPDVVAMVSALAEQGTSIELIARVTGMSRYRVEQLVVAPAGRNDVPYRFRELFAAVDVAERYRNGQSAEEIEPPRV